MRVLILAFSGLLLLGSTVAFLLYVSILSILTVVVILLAAVLMFLSGVQVERQRRRLLENPSEGRMPEVQEVRTSLDARLRAEGVSADSRPYIVN
jgi:uncharacterized protein (DUF58 family)